MAKKKTTTADAVKSQAKREEAAIFAAGCFWGVEAAFARFRGVLRTQVGYCGGHDTNPDYRSVCTGQTGHAEAVEVVFDPNEVTFFELIEFFWEIHDPTSLNQQGHDVGTQYRSAIYCLSEEQLELARKAKAELEAGDRTQNPVVTEISMAGRFYPAEEYHQKYLVKNPTGYCHINLNSLRRT